MIPGLGRSPGEGNGNPPGEFHGQRSLVGYSLRGSKESDTAEQLTQAQACLNMGKDKAFPLQKQVQGGPELFRTGERKLWGTPERVENQGTWCHRVSLHYIPRE